METVKLFESELKLMELLWASEPVSARELARLAADAVGWNKNTTYTIIKKLVEKRVVRREEPGFVCSSLIARDDVRQAETRSLIDKLYGGSKKAFFAAFLEDESLSPEEIDELRRLIDQR